VREDYQNCSVCCVRQTVVHSVICCAHTHEVAVFTAVFVGLVSDILVVFVTLRLYLVFDEASFVFYFVVSVLAKTLAGKSVCEMTLC